MAAVTGLRSEARILRGAADAHGVALAARGTGGSRAGMDACLEALLAEPPDLLISFGLAGALSGALAAGDPILPDIVADPGGTQWRVDEAWQGAVAEIAGRGVMTGIVAGVDQAVTTPAAKVALSERTGAVAVDMESHHVARRARAAGVPFVVLRAVADTARQRVPRAALDLLGADGGVRWTGLPRAMLHPLALLELRRVSAKAHATLHPLADALMRAVQDA